jgi:hypothetical protein
MLILVVLLSFCHQIGCLHADFGRWKTMKVNIKRFGLIIELQFEFATFSDFAVNSLPTSFQIVLAIVEVFIKISTFAIKDIPLVLPKCVDALTIVLIDKLIVDVLILVDDFVIVRQIDYSIVVMLFFIIDYVIVFLVDGSIMFTSSLSIIDVVASICDVIPILDPIISFIISTNAFIVYYALYSHVFSCSGPFICHVLYIPTMDCALIIRITIFRYL